MFDSDDLDEDGARARGSPPPAPAAPTAPAVFADAAPCLAQDLCDGAHGQASSCGWGRRGGGRAAAEYAAFLFEKG